MRYPNNRLIVDGVDLSTEYGLILVDGYTLSPPEPKTYVIDVPGGNSKIDLTESLFGDVAYDNRKQEFTFYVINPESFEKTKTKLSNFLHGKEFDYRITMDPGYTYHGRFAIEEYSHARYSSNIAGAFKITIDAKPYKLKSKKRYTFNAVGGAFISIESGRMRVRPTITLNGFAKLIYNNKLQMLQEGVWNIHDLVLTEGVNELYFNTYDIKSINWSYLKNNPVTWGQFGKKRLYEWYKTNDVSVIRYKRWNEVSDKAWVDMEGQTWGDQTVLTPVGDTVEPVKLEYDWGDL